MNKTKILLISTGVLIALAIVTGISYAVWLLTAEQTNQNILATECFDITFTEDTDSNINLQSTYPLLDSEGKELTPYTFSVTNSCDLNAKYQINLEVLNTTTLSHNLIKTMIDTKTPNIITNNNIVTSTIANSTSYIIKTDYLAYNETNNHEFRMWIDESATLDNSQNKLVEAKIVISAEPTEEIPDYQDPTLAGSDPIIPENDASSDYKWLPVIISDNGTVTIAKTSQKWYDYENSEWANAVIADMSSLSTAPGTIIPMDKIEQMYVWIPRYEYKKSSIVNAQESIEINFVGVETTSTTEQVNNDDVIVHPAFCWGNYCQTNRSHEENVELPGIWVGKFEMGYILYENNPIIKPNLVSIANLSVKNFNELITKASDVYFLNETADVHMIKNTEWGAVAYLSQSKYGICEDAITCSSKVEMNNYGDGSYSGGTITGCGGDDNRMSEVCPIENRWETINGTKASTTHNITGIYDMSGGKYEFVMGVLHKEDGTPYINNQAFTILPEKKYYDSYEYNTSTSDYSKGIIGDATKELYNSSSSAYWNNDRILFITPSYQWFYRGGASYTGANAGIWETIYDNADSGDSTTSRSVLIVEN